MNDWAIPEKQNREGGFCGQTFFYNSPGIFHFFALHLKIPDKGKVDAKRSTTENSTKLCQLHPSEIPRPKTRPPGNSTLFFLLHPSWKLHLVFNLPNSTCYFFDIPGNSISSPHLPVHPPCCFFFSGIAHCQCGSKDETVHGRQEAKPLVILTLLLINGFSDGSLS